MIFDDNTREFNIIEAYHKGKLVGKFVDMRTARDKLGTLADKVSYNFSTVVNEKRDNKLFWELIEKGFVLNNNTKSR